MEVDRQSPDALKVDRSLLKVLQTHRKFTEDDGRTHRCTESGQKMTEGPADARRVHGSLRKVLRTHGQLSKIDRILRGCTETCRKLTEDLVDV